jgi:hypothetical protein
MRYQIELIDSPSIHTAVNPKPCADQRIVEVHSRRLRRSMVVHSISPPFAAWDVMWLCIWMGRDPSKWVPRYQSRLSATIAFIAPSYPPAVS